MTLRAQDLSFRYTPQGRWVLRDFSLALESGASVGLSAPSGFGKTTLCRLLSGYLRPTEGAALLNGKSLSSFRGHHPVQLLWQHPEQALNPRLRMRTLLQEAGPLSGDITDALGIQPEWLERYPGELSGGELQRFAIARALGPETQFLLADEITAMLDLATQAQLWHFLQDHARARGLGLLVVSHSQPLLEQVCDDIISLH